MFLWKAVSGAVPVAERLLTRGVRIDPRCFACGFEGESINHLLFLCPLARQVWAVSNIPSPVNGFADHSLFHNIHYVISMAMVTKVLEDAEEWFLGQQVEKEDALRSVQVVAGRRIPWKPPDNPWLKCNLASSWDKHNSVGGAAWVFRNSSGEVLLHSRRSFGGLESKQDLDFECWMWALESLRSLKIRRCVLAVEEKYLMEAILRPAAWPSFKFQSESLLRAFNLIPFWKVQLEERSANKGAFLIARSVTREDRRQSYVATGYPFWLHDLFNEEMSTT